MNTTKQTRQNRVSILLNILLVGLSQASSQTSDRDLFYSRHRVNDVLLQATGIAFSWRKQLISSCETFLKRCQLNANPIPELFC